MKAQIVFKDFAVEAQMNEPKIEVSTKADGLNVNVLGGVGPQGPQGYSPVRGLDYWTEEDVDSVTAAAIRAVLDAYPAAEGVEF